MDDWRTPILVGSGQMTQRDYAILFGRLGDGRRFIASTPEEAACCGTWSSAQ
jgi:hypothetical protein